jgi:hypothetical protein
LTVLAALCASPAASWAVAFHLAEEHNGTRASHHDETAALERALHGHAHEPGTPAHGHPFLTSAAAKAPGKLFQLIPAALADASELSAFSGSLLTLLPSGPTHDPPPRPASRPVLRI